jgi:acid phosphatase
MYRVFIASLLLHVCGISSFSRNPVNLTIAKQRVEHYYECGRYDKDMNRIINRAIKHFKKMERCHKDAVVFDVDDTVLSNYCDEKDIRFGYIPKLSHEWVLRADAPAIDQTKQLYDYLVGRGFRIVFITGRKHDEYDATIKNLKNQGFQHFDKLIVRSEKEADLSALEYKYIRRAQLVKEGYRIVGNVGDQWSDLKGGNSGYQVKLPNYRYMIE